MPRLKKTNSGNASTGTPQITAVLEDATEYAGKKLKLNGIAATSGPAELLTRSVSDGKGKFVEVPTGEIAATFTRTDENAEGFRALKRIQPGSLVEVSE